MHKCACVFAIFPLPWNNGFDKVSWLDSSGDISFSFSFPSLPFLDVSPQNSWDGAKQSRRLCGKAGLCSPLGRPTRGVSVLSGWRSPSQLLSAMKACFSLMQRPLQIQAIVWVNCLLCGAQHQGSFYPGVHPLQHALSLSQRTMTCRSLSWVFGAPLCEQYTPLLPTFHWPKQVVLSSLPGAG